MVGKTAIVQRRHLDGREIVHAADYDVFAGLDVDKRSIAVTFIDLKDLLNR